MRPEDLPQPGERVDITTKYLAGTPMETLNTYKNALVIEKPEWATPDEISIVTENPATPHLIKARHIIECCYSKEPQEGASPPKGENGQSGQSVINFRSPKSGNTYQITIEDGHAVECSCPGFQFRGRCRHLSEAEGTL